MFDFRTFLGLTTALALAFTLGLPAPATAGGGMNCGFGSFEGEDETIRLFPTYGVISPDGDSVIIPLRVWVYEREDDRIRRYTVNAFRKSLGIEEDSPSYPIFKRRMLDFMVDNERGKDLHAIVTGDGIDSKVEKKLGETGSDGHVSARLEIPYSPPKDTDERSIRLQIRLEDTAYGAKSVEVPIVAAKGVTVVSDIDDTIKITNVVDRKEMLENTFLREFRAVPGMAKHYQKWADRGATFHYVSASPWNLQAELAKLADESGFPSGVYHLRVLRLKDLGGTHDFIKDSRAHKVASIRLLMERFPEREFILVGDTGEKDPEVYGDLAREFPEQITHTYLRRVEGAQNDSERFSAALEGVPASKWTVFSEPDEL